MSLAEVVREAAREWVPYAVGYLFAIIGGGFKSPGELLWKRWGREKLEDATNVANDGLPGRVVGYIERPLYVAAINANFLAFIGIWLAAKAIGGWEGWSKGIDVSVPGGSVKIPGRNVANVFLIGSAVSLAYAAVGASLIASLKNGDWYSAVGEPVALIAMHATLRLWLRRQVPDAQPAAGGQPQMTGGGQPEISTVAGESVAQLREKSSSPLPRDAH